MDGRRQGAGQVARADRLSGRRRRAQHAGAVQRQGGRQQPCVVGHRHAGRAGHQPAQHIHEQARQRQIRPVGVGRHVEQHHLAPAHAGCGHQRRAVGQPRPGLRGGVGWVGQDLPVDAHLGRDAQARERRAVRKRRQMGRLAPRHRTPQLAVAGQQAAGQQRVGILAGGQAGAGEAQQQPAALHPVAHLRRFAGGQRARGDHQHGELSGQQGGHIAAAQLGGGRQRAVQVEQVAQQRRVGAGAGAHQPHRPAARRLVQQRDRAGTLRPVQPQRAQLVAQLGRQRQRRLGVGGAGRHQHGRARQDAAVVGLGQHEEGLRQAGWGLTQMGGQLIGRSGGAQQAGRQRAGQHGDRAAARQRARKRRILGGNQTVGDVEHRAGPADGACGTRPIDRPWLRLQRGQDRAQHPSRHRRGAGRCCPIRPGCGGQQGGLPAGALQPVQHRARRGQALRKIRAGRPAVVDHQQRRAAPGDAQPVAGQHRAGQAQDHERGRRDAQGQQPPGRARGRFLRGAQAGEQADGRKILRARCGRRGAQQPPQHGQGDQRGQHPGGGEDHVCVRPASSAVHNASSAPSGGWSVRCAAKPKPAASQVAASPACWVASASP